MLGLLVSATPAAAQKVTVYDVPGSITTFFTGINDSGTIVGYYEDSQLATHGFFIAQGKLTVFDVPGSTGQTYAVSVNSAGTIVGFYANGGPTWMSGFMRAADGTFTTFEPPYSWTTQAMTISPSGVIAGIAEAFGSGGPQDGSERGFVRDLQGNINLFAPPDNLYAYVRGLGPDGIVVGDYIDAAESKEHAFIRRPAGALQTFSFPGSTLTTICGMTSTGWMAGAYGNQNLPPATHGFLMNPQGRVLSFDVPGSSGTYPIAINPSGIVIGVYYTGTVEAQGFLRGPKGGIRIISAPGSASTSPAAINASSVVVGSWTAPNGIHGFVWQPASSSQAIGDQ